MRRPTLVAVLVLIHGLESSLLTVTPPIGTSSVAFVFDVTGSMHDDLLQVMQGATHIYNATLRREYAIYDYILIPFADPDVGPILKTRDPLRFQRGLRDLIVQGGGDCPEMTITAIKLALEQSLPHSFIYVFTDARSKDYLLGDAVLKLIQEKQSQVVFVMTGDCGDQTHIGYQVFHKIAATSSGQVFSLHKQQVSEILSFVQHTIQTRKVNLLVIDKVQRNKETFTFAVDSKLLEFTVSVSGANPQVTLTDPSKKVLNPRSWFTRLLRLKEVYILNVKHPMIGEWQVQVTSSSPHAIRITGLSRLTFRHGFSSKVVADLAQTRRQPIQGSPSYLHVEMQNEDDHRRAEQVELIDLFGNVLVSERVQVNPIHSTFYSTVRQFQPPADSFFFYIRLSGLDSNGHRFQRLSSTALSSHIPSKPVVDVDSKTMQIKSNVSVQLECHVQSQLPFQVQWFRNGQLISAVDYAADVTTVNYSIEYPTEIEDEGFYLCNVTSTNGFEIGEINVDVLALSPIVRTLPSKSLFVLINSTVSIDCLVQSTKDYRLTWKREMSSSKVVEPSKDRTTIYENGTLQLRNIQQSDDGSVFLCIATNEGGETSERLTVHVQELPHVHVYPQMLTFSNQWNVTLTCVGTAGIPRPLLIWRRQHTHYPIEQSTTVRIYDGVLTIQMATKADEGVYECVGTNPAGEDRKTAQLTYADLPMVSTDQSHLLVSPGEDIDLSCNVDGQAFPDIRWFRGTEPVTRHRTNPRGHLLIRNASEDEDGGNYTCFVESTVGSSSASLRLDIGRKPTIQSVPETKRIELGQSTQLECQTDGSPSPQISWHQNNTQLLSPVVDRSTLTIADVQTHHAGIYTCLASNLFGSTTVNITLIVIMRPSFTFQSDEHLTGIVSKSLLLPCYHTGIPTPIVRWFKDKEPLLLNNDRIMVDNSGSLIIHSLVTSDRGLYLCQVTNDVGQAKHPFQVDVYEPPSFVATALDIELDVNVSQSVLLPCSVTGHPSPTIVWFRQDRPIHDDREMNTHLHPNGSLEIRHVQSTHSDRFHCTATNPAGTASRSVQIHVNVPPFVADSEEVTVVQVTLGKSITLVCPAIGIPTPTIHWFRNDQPLPLTVSTDQYILQNIESTDEGVYRCIATNKAGTTFRVFNVSIQMLPYFEHQTGNVSRLQQRSVIFNHSLTLLCPAIGSPKPNLVWYFNGKEIQPEKKHLIIKQHGKKLVIHRIRSQDEGRYICQASNAVGSIDIVYDMDVIIPPKFNEDTGGIFAKEQSFKNGEHMRLTCSVQGKPIPKRRWFFNKQSIIDTTRFRLIHDGLYMEIDHLTLNDAGRYTCVAENQAGRAETHVDIDVAVPPVFNDSLSQMRLSVLLNTTITLVCSAYGYPKPSIRWSRNLNSFLTPQGKTEELIIDHVQIADAGIYECIATNKAGEARRQFHVEPYAPPSIGLSNETRRLIVPRHQRLTVTCPATGHPSPATRWYKNEVELNEFNNDLSIPSVDRGDAGLYSCVASNSAGTDRRYFHVIVSEPPEILRSHINPRPSVVRGSSITLSCPHTTERSLLASEINTTWIPPMFGDDHRRSRHDLKLNENQLTISNVQLEDGQRWTCVIANEYGSDSLEFELEILVPPEISSEETEEFLQVENNHTVQLLCQTLAQPAARIEWRKNGHPINAEKYLIIKNNQTEILQIFINNEQDGGTFTCLASNPIGKTEKHFFVDIFLPPTFEYVSTNRHKIPINRTYTLPCLVKGIPRPTIRWLKDGKHISIDKERLELLRDHQYLEIRHVNEEDAGIYTCSAENLAGKAKQDLELQVLVPPRLGQDATNIEAMVNSTVNLTCSAYGKPKPTIVWFKEGRHLQYGNRYLPVHVPSVQNEARTEYTCMASNEAGSVEQHYRIQLLVPPSIDSISISPTSTPIAGHHFTLECQANGIPEPTVIWHFNGRPLSRGSNRYHQIIRASLNDTGLYTCTVENKLGSTRKDIDIDVMLPPSIRNNGQLINEMTVVKGEVMLFTCLLHAIPVPTIIWTKNDQLLVPSDRLVMNENNLRLRINNASLNDRGRYQCQAENAAGRSEQIFDVQVYNPPEIRARNLNRNPYVVLGKSVVLSCHGFGVPEINYQWLKDQKTLSDSHSYARLFENGAKLHIDSARSSDAGLYTCLMSNVAGQVNLTYNLDVYTPPTIDRSNIVEVYQVKSNQTARLECPMYGTPQPRIRWLINSVELKTPHDRYKFIEENRALIIHPTQLIDNARFTCIGTNIAGELANHIDLQIFVPPTIQRDPDQDHLRVIQHHHVALTCTADGDPWPSVSWEKDGHPVDTSGSRYRIGPAGFQLLIIQADPSQAGTYTCVAFSKAGEAKQQFHLTVLVPPRIQRENNSIVVIAPKHVELPCHVSQGHPTPTVKWLHNRMELRIAQGKTDRKHLLSSANSLLILHTQKSDNGQYRCVISNEAGQDLVDLVLDVFVPPVVTVESNEILGIVNRPTTLNCQVDGHPLPTISWTRAARPIDTQPGFQVLTNGSLRIHHLQIQDTGYYLCWAENLVRRTYAQIRLEVQVPPSIDQVEHYFTGVAGQALKLSCQATGIPIPTISWQGVTNHSGSANVDTFGNLYIDRLEKHHAGELLCTASNAVGQTSKQFTLIVVDQPSTSTSPSITHANLPQQLPSLSISPSHLLADYADRIELICQSHLIHPFDIHWLFNGELVEERQSIGHVSDGSVLRIERATDEHTGVYQCFSNQTFAQHVISSMPVTLTVRPHPASHSQAITAGQRLTVSCEIDSEMSGSFLGTIEWFHNGSPMRIDSVQRNRIDYGNGTLTIDQTSGSDSGVYKCVFRSDNGTRAESYHAVNILTRPAFTIKLPRSTQRLVRGSMLMLHCLADAWPEATLRWTHNDTVLAEIDGSRVQILNNNSLKIEPIQVSDTGRYACAAENALGKATTTCDVIVYEVPSTASTVTRQLRGHINQRAIDHLELQSNSLLRQASINPIDIDLVPLFETLFPFLFPPSFSSPLACRFDRQMTIALIDGRSLTITEKASEMRMEFNGSFPDDYRWANQTQITETILPMDSGMCPTGTVLTFHPLERRPTDSDFTGDQCVTDFY